MRAVFGEADRYLRPVAPFYVAGPSGRLGATFMQEIEQTGWHLAQTLIWVKTSAT